MGFYTKSIEKSIEKKYRKSIEKKSPKSSSLLWREDQLIFVVICATGRCQIFLTLLSMLTRFVNEFRSGLESIVVLRKTV